jgi:O-antigen/teichoic acid export membrane protein
MNAVPIPSPGVRQLATYLAARVVPALISMALTFLCIRSLSAADYGIYSLTLLPASVATGLIGGLSGQAMLRYAHELAPGELQRGLVAFPLVASAFAVPIVLSYLAWSLGVYAGIFVAVSSIPLIAMMDTRRSLFVALARADAVFLMDSLRALAALALTWLLFQASGAHATAPLLAQALSVAICLALVRAGPGPLAAAPLRRVDRRYVAYGAWFAGWMAVLVAISVAERSVVGAVSGIASSGRYAAQSDVVNAIFSATGGALASSMMPRYLAMARSEDGPTMRHLLGIGLAGSVAAGLLCLLLGLCLFLAGSGQVAATLTSDPRTAVALVLAGVVWTGAGFVQKPLELRGQTWRVFAAVLLAMLFFLGAGPVMGRWLGPAGVGLAKLGAGLVFVLLVLIASRRQPG